MRMMRLYTKMQSKFSSKWNMRRHFINSIWFAWTELLHSEGSVWHSKQDGKILKVPSLFHYGIANLNPFLILHPFSPTNLHIVTCMALSSAFCNLQDVSANYCILFGVHLNVQSRTHLLVLQKQSMRTGPKLRGYLLFNLKFKKNVNR